MLLADVVRSSRLAIKKISSEGTLVCGQGLAAAERVEKNVSVFAKDRTEQPGRFGDRQILSVLRRTVAGNMDDEAWQTTAALTISTPKKTQRLYKV